MVCICLFYECVYIMSYNNNNNIIVNIYTYTYILFWIIYTIICTSCQLLLLLVKKYKWQSHSIHIYFITFNWNGCHRIPFPNEHFVCFHFLLPFDFALQSKKNWTDIVMKLLLSLLYRTNWTMAHLWHNNNKCIKWFWWSSKWNRLFTTMASCSWKWIACKINSCSLVYSGGKRAQKYSHIH